MGGALLQAHAQKEAPLPLPWPLPWQATFLELSSAFSLSPFAARPANQPTSPKTEKLELVLLEQAAPAGAAQPAKTSQE